ncbi:pyridoxamine 5'-phosphate oxidase family protein [Mesobacillus sp. AQ2]|uniref:pyridoxamine 5'-phosphate oxidase family protein n=1 Tax=Bacillaceae TaxID=186817 RepID=UPI0011AB074C|nr:MULTISPECIES: pyridoxamine 5'-phosphate oxidase family protein [Bacillaceae]MCM3121718.1 pyridoxamine 5'-phosphate oxidase family protein [Mesobacillus sp. MER 33]MCM3231682.1 pyridoxamine 5'-phosphate oxidase family protein [Mesobacillus sp. MER 48]WHX38649.1 pyridoxamine 5'-phosphate oxidase family protein [Mesobacillus sp. AQ2]
MRELDHTIKSFDELRERFGEPSELAKRKVISYVDEHCRNYISKSPFLILSTSDKDGCSDASPRGDTPGFVLILDKNRIVIPDRPGNKRMDSLKNILSNPQVGLLFLIPGMSETLRVNGRASLTLDPELLGRMAAGGKNPLLGIEIEVEECFIQCGKALRRSGLWVPESWADPSTLPSGAEILAAHSKLPGTTAAEIKDRLEDGYRNRLY